MSEAKGINVYPWNILSPTLMMEQNGVLQGISRLCSPDFRSPADRRSVHAQAAQNSIEASEV